MAAVGSLASLSKVEKHLWGFENCAGKFFEIIRWFSFFVAKIVEKFVK